MVCISAQNITENDILLLFSDKLMLKPTSLGIILATNNTALFHVIHCLHSLNRMYLSLEHC